MVYDCGLKLAATALTTTVYRSVVRSSPHDPCGPTSSLGLDGLDGLGDLGLQGGGQRSGAGGILSGLLALVGGHVGQPSLGELSLLGVLVGRADDVVGDQDNRVSALGLGGVVDLDDDAVVTLNGVVLLGIPNDLGAGLGGNLVVLVADLDGATVPRSPT